MKKKSSILKKVVWKRVMVFATLFLFVVGAILPVVKKADATDDFDWAWSSGSGTTGDLYRTGNVSIGDSSSPSKLYVTDGAVLFSGTTGGTPTSGAGKRLMWIPAKSAFRAGYVTGSQWDDANIGTYSMALGINTIASGLYSTAMGGTTTASGNTATAMGAGTTASGNRSTAMGDTTTASGYASTAMGRVTTASGNWATAMGEGTTASGNRSTAMGEGTTASGYASTAMGRATTASGLYSTAMGQDTNASGDYGSTTMGYETTASGMASTAMGASTTASGNRATAMGSATTASGDFSTAMGTNTIASGLYSTALGYHTTASGALSTALGYSTTASGNYSTAMGREIEASGNYSIAIALNDQNGAVVSQANTMAIMGGNVGIDTTSPNAKLDVRGDAVFNEDGGDYDFRIESDIDPFMIYLDAGSDRLGIGEPSPDAKLHVDGGLLCTGSSGGTPVSGAGTRLMWIPSKAAFRAGRCTGSYWDNSNIGDYSIATGYDTTASGYISTAMGIWSIANGTYATAMGRYTTASGEASTALGKDTTASGDVSTALGYHTTASGALSTALGYETTASGNYATTMGREIEASGNYSIAIALNDQNGAVVSQDNTMAIMGGNVGIGTTSPSEKLDVSGNVHASGSFTSGSTTTYGDGAITLSGGTNLNVDANTLFVDNANNRIGIGSTTPSAKLEVTGGAVLFSGSSGGTPVSGAGTRLMWIPAKVAFRAGYAGGSEWDDANIGSCSVAMGVSTTASGYASTALGYHTVASGWYPTAMGYQTIASGDSATAMGRYTSASGYGATAMGIGTTASGIVATAMGVDTMAWGNGSTAMGYDTTASGYVSTAMGESTTASGNWSMAMGRTITVSGMNSVGIGLNSTEYTVSDDNVISIMGGRVGIGTVSPDANYSMEIQGNPKGLYVKTADNTYQSIVGQCHHQYRPAGFVLENRYPASASFPKGVMMRFKGMDTNGVMQEYLAFIAEYVTRTAGAIDGDCWIRPVKNNAANWAFRFTHDGKLLIKDGGSASDLPESALHVVGAINLDPIPAPSAPTTGFIIYCDQADGDLKAKSDTGIVTTIATD